MSDIVIYQLIPTGNSKFKIKEIQGENFNYEQKYKLRIRCVHTEDMVPVIVDFASVQCLATTHLKCIY